MNNPPIKSHNGDDTADEKATAASIIIVYDHDEQAAKEIAASLAAKYATKNIPFSNALEHISSNQDTIVISYLLDSDHLQNLTSKLQNDASIIHIALASSDHCQLLQTLVAENKLYKFLVFPDPNLAIEAHVLEALHELQLRNKRRDLVNEINSMSNQLKERSAQQTTNSLFNHAQIDPLTNLPNRYLIFDRINQAISSAKRNKHMSAILSIDLDRFSVINQSLGLRFGNQLLREFSQRLVTCTRQSDTVAREGNDEFLLVMSSIESSESVIQLIKRIQSALAEPFIVNQQEIFLTASIGICIYPNDGDEPESLVRAANTAMKHAKQLGGNCYQYFQSDMNDRIRKLVDMESHLFRALEKKEFVLYYQPQVDIKSGEIVGAEALLRWLRPGLGIVPPNEFIPILEDTGLIEQVGEWIFHNVSEQSDHWSDQGLPDLRMSINLSLRQVQDESILKNVAKLISQFKSADRARSIELEITESIMMKDANKAITLLIELNKMGFNLAIDDFGTGYASLNYLTRFPVSCLKIDLSFVQRIETSPKDAAIVNAIIAMAHSLGLRVTAEGVETQQQLDYLSQCGCDEIQGYLFSKPLPANEFETLLRSNKRLSVPN